MWRGRFQGTVVAIKKAKVEVQAKVFDESEVRFMIGLQHNRLVKFIGAGQIWDDLNQGDVVFSVQAILLHRYGMSFLSHFVVVAQEFLSGGSLDNHLWDKPIQSVDWAQKLQWAVDTAEALDCPSLPHSASLFDAMLFSASLLRIGVGDRG